MPDLNDTSDIFGAPIGGTKRPTEDDRASIPETPVEQPGDDASDIFGAPVSGSAQPDDVVSHTTPDRENPAAIGGEAAARAGMTGGGFVAGAGIGVKAGLVAAAPFPPAAAVTVPLFGAAGAYVGMRAGETAGDSIFGGDQDPAQTDPGRVAQVAGETFGATIGPLGPIRGIAITAAGKLPDTAIGRFLDNILASAAGRASQFFGVETSAAIGASGGAAVAESAFPGEMGPRIFGEIAGGIASPAQVARVTYNLSAVPIVNFVTRHTRSGQLSNASSALRQYVREAGGDPEMLVELLQDRTLAAKAIPGYEASAAQTTGSRILADLEQDLGEHSDRFRRDLSRSAQKSFEAITNATALLRADGSPEALRTAAALQQRKIEVVISDYIQADMKAAEEAALRIAGPDALRTGVISEAKRSEISRSAIELLDNHLSSMREIEQDLWSKAFKDANVAAPPNGTIGAYSRVRGELAAGEQLHPLITAHMDAVFHARDVVADAGNYSTGELANAQRLLSVGESIRFRRALLGVARDLSVSTRGMSDTQARHIAMMIDGVHNDLERAGAAAVTQDIPEGGVGAPFRVKGRFSADDTPFDKARRFSKALSDTYRRSFVGEARKKGMNTPPIPPELMLRRAFASGGERADLQLSELDAAMKFDPQEIVAAVDEGLLPADGAAKEMVKLQDDFIRILAAQGVREKDGRWVANPTTLRNFARKHEAVLERFPQIKEDIKNALSSEEALNEHVKRWSGVRKNYQAVYARILGSDSPSDVVAGALASKTPIARLDELVKVASAGGDEAVEGLRAATWEAMFRMSRAADGSHDLAAVQRWLQDPIRPGLPSMRDYMADNGLISKENLEGLENALNNVVALTTSGGAIGRGVNPAPQVGMMEAGLLRMAGSEIARRILHAGQRMVAPVTNKGTGGAGPTLIAAFWGAKMAVNLFANGPFRRAQYLMQDALMGAPLTPGGERFSLLEAMLEGASTPAQQVKKIEAINIYMWNAGLKGPDALNDIRGEDDDVDNSQQRDTIPEPDVSMSEFVSETKLRAGRVVGQAQDFLSRTFN